MDPLHDHLRLVEGLRRQLAAVHPGEAVQVLHTHLSTVLLAGEDAWKLKKPLALGFADFSTLERRRHFCEEELRLNRRTAPSLYLDVRPVGGTPEQPQLGALREGEPVLEWVLHMRRFDDGALLSVRAARGGLTPALADALAQRVAAFHEGLAPSPPGFGLADNVRRWAVDNLRELIHDAPAQAERLAALAAWTEAEFERIAPRLARRAREGRVRECHGDLHLANLVLIDGEPRPFDAIEFNPELRHIDVASDAAFPFMDLMAHGLPRLAWRFVDGWSEALGDREALALLPFFAVYRALVRAKVALLRAAQVAPGAQEHARQRGDFERRLALAETLARPRPLHLVLTCGLSGSGKSTVAQALLESLGALRLRSDVERKRLHGLAPAERPADLGTLYGGDATRRTYDALAALARMLLEGGTPVVVDAAFLRRGERDTMRALAGELGARFAIVECEAPEAVLRARLREREAAGGDPSDATEAVLDLQLRAREPLQEDERERAWTLDTDVGRAELRALADAVAEALQRD